MSKGKVSLAYSSFLGYTKGDGSTPLKIVDEEAQVIRRIYGMFIRCYSVNKIAKTLTDEGVPTPMKKKKWATSTVTRILTNEKYKGDALLQKTYTVDFLSKKVEKNEGQLPQYYLSGSHEPIIPPEMFDMVQELLEKRAGGYTPSVSVFSNKLVCSCCGGFFGSKVWHSTDKYRTVIWQCNRKYSGNKKCSNRHITETELKEEFLKTLSSMVGSEASVVKSILHKEVFDTTGLEKERAELEKQNERILEDIKREIKVNSVMVQNQEDYLKRYHALCVKHDETEAEIENINTKIQGLNARKTQADTFIKTLKQLEDTTLTWDDDIWTILVDKAIVSMDGIQFVFNDGREA